MLWTIKHWFWIFQGICILIKRSFIITKTRLFKYTENFTTKKWKFLDKKFWYFSYFCTKHRLWYALEPPQRGDSNAYPHSIFLSRNKKNNVYPCKPQFYYIKMGFKGVKIIQAYFHDETKITTKIIEKKNTFKQDRFY